MNKLLDFFGFGRQGGGGPAGPNKRNLWLAGLAVLGVLMLVFSTVDKTKSNQKQTPASESSNKQIQEQVKSGMLGEEELLSKKLCAMLKNVEGAGEVEVSVRLSDTTQYEYAVNTTTGKKTTQERDQSGGTRTTTEDNNSNQLVMNRDGQGEQPVVEREVAPHVAGVLVVAEGAVNPKVKAMLFQATEVAMGIEPQKILVLPRERRE
ncbi:MAG: hypothetical protein A4E52_00200 [Pelotomaculum sp. PtaB.Bin013]|uniref:Stage III sporulation protein AG n=1 Tax=Pelotomaculum isophthalicicum JI TaxID=947010 RepID=A0A9X4GY59_9FIRM|nr:hypothetical protein [Pelotomaculum isophthalicicum]MDF9407490.1 hypothetical protein [Pelotomaculum isophthalicicum JI]OPX91989.1 MAG: hypothetical protein A4E52_00200 [Pelotomaculum sp. PtaB.Bin013]